MVCLFFKKKIYWDIVGHDVTRAILSVLNSRYLFHKINYTHIVLVPKENDPKYLVDFRPISLGNVISRLLSKVLANCLKLAMPQVISDAQSAFIPDRFITDNTIVAFKLLHKMRNRRRGKDG